MRFRTTTTWVIWGFVIVVALAQDVQVQEDTMTMYKNSRNISNWYIGQWEINRSASPGYPLFNFQRERGKIHMAVKLGDSKEDIQLIKGDIEFRDGNFTSDTRNQYDFQGIYIESFGLLYFIANPKDQLIVTDHTILLDDVPDLVQKIRQEYAIGLNESTKEFTPTMSLKPELCALRGLLNVRLDTGTYYTKDEERFETIILEGSIRSPQCGLEWHNVHMETDYVGNYISKAANYSLMMLVATGLYVFLLIDQMKYTSTQSSLAKVSLLTLALQTVLDAFLCLIHLLASLSFEPLFKPFILTTFFLFVSFSIFQMRYIILVWKSRRPQAFSNGWESVQRELSVLYIRFYGLLVGGFLILYYFSELFIVFVFLIYSFWIPQIYCNITRDSNRAFTLKYILGTSILRLLLPAYMYGCPANFIQIEPRPHYFVYLSIFVGLMVSILVLQDVFGPRFFFPKQLLPRIYNYKRPIPTNSAMDTDCVICMSQVDVSIKLYMITPCNHIFHQQCLIQWLEHKMECPTCRRQLPQPSASILNSIGDHNVV